MTHGSRTTLVTAGRDRSTSFDFVNPPLVRGSTVLHASIEQMRDRLRRRDAGQERPVAYGTQGTPTHHAFYDALTELEGGHASWALPSGLAACTMAILAYVQQGDHVLLPDSVYFPTRRFCRGTLPRYGVEATFYDPRAGAELEHLFRPTTRVLFLESPGSLTFEMQDVPLLASMARRHDAISIIDNTWATPLYFQPLRHGVDVSVHAATKYIGGHSDLLMGTVTCNARAWPRMRETILHYGLTTSPDDCWLALRGLRSMAARLVQHRVTAERLIEVAAGAARGRPRAVPGTGGRSGPRPVATRHDRSVRPVRCRAQADGRASVARPGRWAGTVRPAAGRGAASRAWCWCRARSAPRRRFRLRDPCSASRRAWRTSPTSSPTCGPASSGCARTARGAPSGPDIPPDSRRHGVEPSRSCGLLGIGQAHRNSGLTTSTLNRPSWRCLRRSSACPRR